MAVIIDRIETFAVNYPVDGYFKFFENPDGRPMGRSTVVVKITADDGTVGWGQSVPSQRWSYETLETATIVLRDYFAPALMGLDPLDIDAAQAALDRANTPSVSSSRQEGGRSQGAGSSAGNINE